MKLGAFSMSLAVKDITASQEFYGKLGFEPCLGDPKQNWLILRNGSQTIGLFQGMLPKNTLTFNPGWDQNGQPVKDFTDIRKLQQLLIERDVAIESKIEANAAGPASFVLIDPDGNPILFDQHV